MLDLLLAFVVALEAAVRASLNGLVVADTDHAWDLLTSVTGGIIGALAGGVPAYALAVKATREATAKDEANQLQLDLGTLQSAFVKLLEIVNGTYTICSQINEMLYNAHANGHKDWQLWQKVLPLLGADVGPSVRFDSREIALFMRKLESNDFANALTLLDKRYEALKAVVKSYSDRRERLMAMLPASELIDGVGTTKLKKEEASRVIPLAYALNQVASQIIDMMHKDRREAQRLADDFGSHAKRLFPKSVVPSFSMVA